MREPVYVCIYIYVYMCMFKQIEIAIYVIHERN